MISVQRKEEVKKHFDEMAPYYDQRKKKNYYYYNSIKNFIKRNVAPESRVLEIGCATGEVLAATKPFYGVGIDFSGEMIKLAAKKYPDYHFLETSIEDFDCDETFDYILLVDVVHHVYDVREVFEKIRRLSHPRTKIIVTVINPWWDPFLKILEKFKAKLPDVPLNYLERRNLGRILEPLDFSITQTGCLLLLPKFVPFLSYLVNSLGVRLWGINKLSFVQYMIIQTLPENSVDLGLGCSVIIPCHNEEGNIVEAIKRIPKMGKLTEIIVVNDGSTDQTAERVREIQKEYNNVKLVDYSPNRGKGNAVKRGFDTATQEVVMILDADMTVVPEALPKFFNPLNKGLCQFVNGTRLVYPKENQSMRFLNQLGNKLFCLLMTFITNQILTDTLCGTKALYRKDYKRMKWGMDKWGDFDLLFGAAKMGSKIMEIPVHYMSRKSGESKMKSFQHGMHLLKACFQGFKELIFVPYKELYQSDNDSNE